jgi:transcription elongation factor Elf1
MIDRNQTIPCPVCGSSIAFDARQLLAGGKFTCTRCGESISIASSGMASVAEALRKMEELKRRT